MFYCTLVYHFMVDLFNGCGAHRKVVIGVAREQFNTLAIKVTKEFSGSDGILQTICLVTATFACLWFVNDTRSLSREIDSADGKKRATV